MRAAVTPPPAQHELIPTKAPSLVPCGVARLLTRSQLRGADIEMLLAHVDAGVGPSIAIRYPTLRMHIHRQLFGLHG